MFDTKPNLPENKNVLIIAPQPFFTQRGTPINIRAMAQALVEGGYCPTLLVYPFGDDIELKDIRVVRTFRPFFIRNVSIGFSIPKLILDFCLALTALKLVYQGNFKIIHGIEEGAFIAGFTALLSKTPYIVDLDSDMSLQMKKTAFPFSHIPLSVYIAIERLLLKRAALAISVCRALSEKARLLAPKVPVVQIEDIPVAQALKLTPTLSPETLRKQLAPHGETIVLYTGNFEEYQGVDILLHGFHGFLSSIKDGQLTNLNDLSRSSRIKLVIVGGTKEANKSLSQQVNALHISASVALLGEQPINEIPAYEQAASYLISPRKYGCNTPLKLYSYMSSGIPILATNIESHTQVLDCSSAFLFEPNAESLAQLLLRINNDPTGSHNEGQAKATRAKHIVDTNYSWDAFSDKLLKAYRTVMQDENIERQPQQVINE